jgi:hypothetical protein
LKINNYDIPILIIGFTRPELIAKQILILEKIKPKKIYFYLDGPRSEEEALKMHQTQLELEKINWTINIHRNINVINKGAAKAITEAISWVFTNENNLIILEDDVLPCVEFFDLCEYYLKQTLKVHNIGAICGHQVNSQEVSDSLTASLSKYPRIHGWATQKNIWDEFHFDDKIPILKFIKTTIKLSEFNIFFLLYLLTVNLKIKLKKLDTWDYQFLYFLNLKSYYCIVPSKNLIINLGYGDSATNTKLKGIEQKFEGEGLDYNFNPVPSLQYSVGIDKKWRNYRIEMLFRSLYQKIKKMLKSNY